MAKLGPHEALELHEMLRTEALGAIKVRSMLPVVTDPELKAFMEQSLQTKQARIERMREFARSALH